MNYEEITNIKISQQVTVNKDVYPSLLKGQICKFNGLKNEDSAYLISTVTGNTYIVKFKNIEIKQS